MKKYLFDAQSDARLSGGSFVGGGFLRSYFMAGLQ